MSDKVNCLRCGKPFSPRRTKIYRGQQDHCESCENLYRRLYPKALEKVKRQPREKNPCGSCNGSGRIKEYQCQRCDGKGYTLGVITNTDVRIELRKLGWDHLPPNDLDI